MSILDLALSPKEMNPANLVLLYGNPGSGKTKTAVDGGLPLVLSLENNGAQTIREVNPNARVIQLVNPTTPRENLKTIREVFSAIRSGEAANAGYDRLVIDSLTELQRYIKDDIAAHREGNGTKTTDEFALNEWGMLGERMRRFMREVRGLNFPVVCTALCDTLSIEGVNGVHRQTFGPAFQGRKTGVETAQFFSAVGYCFKKQRNNETFYKVMFDGPETYITKSTKQARGVVPQDVLYWLELTR